MRRGLVALMFLWVTMPPAIGCNDDGAGPSDVPVEGDVANDAPGDLPEDVSSDAPPGDAPADQAAELDAPAEVAGDLVEVSDTASETGGPLDIAVCAPDAGPFTLAIDNPFFPLPVGLKLVLEGDDGGATVRLEITVLDETETVAGVETRVVEERETEDGELVEVSRNFFVQAPDGTVCYYGEDVDIYDGGEVVSHEGAWRAGEGTNRPGIIMPAAPAVGQVYDQESAPGVAEDFATITAIGATVEVPAGTFTDTVLTTEGSHIEPGTSDKAYARGVGLIVDDAVRLLSSSGP